jgi:hypothetical protein
MSESKGYRFYLDAREFDKTSDLMGKDTKVYFNDEEVINQFLILLTNRTISLEDRFIEFSNFCKENTFIITCNYDLCNGMWKTYN